MKQILHIFVKDVRRFWPEILVSVGLLTALVLVCTHLLSLPQNTEWRMNEIAKRSMKLTLSANILVAFIVAGWWLLITRVIHAERLVGESSFWITRPYDWKRLLAAKLCFLAVFLYVPLALAQTLILAAAGLNPFASIPGMLFNLMLITGICILPLIAIAAVTSTFFRTTLTLLCVLAAIAPFAVTDIFNAGRPMETNLFFLLYGGLPLSHLLPTGDQFSLALLGIAACGTAIVLQYAFRRPWPARIALLAIPAIIGIAAFTVPSHPDLSNPPQLNLHYPPSVAGDAGPVQMSDGRDEHHPLVVHRDTPVDDFIWVKVPLLLSPIQEGTAVTPENTEVTVTNASGFSWKTKALGWYPEHNLPVSSNRSGFWPELRRQISFTIPLAVYDKFKSSPVTVHLTLPLAELHVAKVTRIPMPVHEVSVPGVGVCRVGTLGYGMIRCRSAFRQPELTYVSADWSQEPCLAAQTEMKEVRGETWMGYSDAEPADMGIVPIQYSYASFMPDHNNPTGGKHLCTDTPITFTQYKLIRHTQTSLTLQNIHLAE